MFYDLNVPYSPGDPEIVHTLNFLAERACPSPPKKARDQRSILRIFFKEPHEELT